MTSSSLTASSSLSASTSSRLRFCVRACLFGFVGLVRPVIIGAIVVEVSSSHVVYMSGERKKCRRGEAREKWNAKISTSDVTACKGAPAPGRVTVGRSFPLTSGYTEGPASPHLPFPRLPLAGRTSPSYHHGFQNIMDGSRLIDKYLITDRHN